MNVLTWIWNGLKWICRQIGILLQFGLNAITSWVTWVVGLITYLVSRVAELLNSYLLQAFEWLNTDNLDLSVADDVFSLGSQSWAGYVLVDWFAFDKAVEVLGMFFLVWVVAKAARVAVIPIRVVLDVL